MKSFVYLILALMLVNTVLVTACTIEPVHVAGKIYQSDLVTIVPSADVTVTCLGNELETTSLLDGTYSVTYDNSVSCQCDLGSVVNVDASKGGQSGSNSGIVEEFEDGLGLDLNIAVVNVSIPEFGVIAASVAMIGAIAGIVAFRRH